MAVLSLFAAAGALATTGYSQATTPSTTTPSTTTTTTTTTTPTSTEVTTPAPATNGETTTLEKFVVTGSYLPMSADAPTMPVTSIDAQQIANSGENTNLMQVLQKIAPQFSGGLNLGPTNGNIASNSTSGGSQVALRNLPTLVLINGQRESFAPVASVGGFEFVDLNLIPVSAVEKIEILTDGGSAIYGSDAIGGVVNIILKSEYNGFEVGGSYTWAPNLQSGHYSERNAYVTGGVSNGTTSITISAEWAKSDPLYQYQVSTSQFTVGTTNYPGVINTPGVYYLLNPSLAAPPAGHLPIAALVAAGVYSGPYTSSYIIDHFNLSSKPTSEIGDGRKSFVMNFDHKISDNLKFTGDVLYSDTQTFSQLNAQPIAETIPASDPNNPTNAAYTAHNRFTTYPRMYLADTSSIQGVASLEGKISADYSWKISADYNEQEQHFQNPNLVDVRELEAAEANDVLDLFANTQPAGAIANSGIFGTAIGEFETSLITYDALFRGKPFTLPGGDVEFALGAQFRKEGLSSNADINSLPATFDWDSGTTITPLTTSRNIWAEFGQVNIPIVSPSMKIPFVYSLSTSDAIRHEEYAGTSDKPVDPLFSVRYQPFDDELTLRGTWTKAFVAPTLFELYGPGGIGFSDDLTNFQQYNGPLIANDGQANESSGSNAGLKPSVSENYTIGFVYSPKAVKGLTFTADYYRIRYTSIVGTTSDVAALQDVETNGPASPFAQFTALNNFPGKPGSTPITAPGQVAADPQLVYFVNADVNLEGIKYEGLDMKVNYDWEMAGVGRFTVTSVATYNFKYWVLSPGAPSEETAGKATFFNGTIPRYRAYTTLEYNRGGWLATLANTWIPALTDDDDGEHIDPYYTFDASIGYTFSQSDPGYSSWLKGMTVTFGMNNILNRQPSNDYDVFVTDNADISTYSPFGRMCYIQASYKF